jgi:hypothetical protein
MILGVGTNLYNTTVPTACSKPMRVVLSRSHQSPIIHSVCNQKMRAMAVMAGMSECPSVRVSIYPRVNENVNIKLDHAVACFASCSFIMRMFIFGLTVGICLIGASSRAGS